VRGVLDTTLCEKVCQCVSAGMLFSPGTPFSCTNKTDRHDIAEILLKVALNTTTLISIGQYNFIFHSNIHLLLLKITLEITSNVLIYNCLINLCNYVVHNIFRRLAL
jgi:hypothetical protein